ncbi:MAG: glycosyltransferase family 39 protein [Anaerolineae bacterium]|nr:glycosyltransferase family 39 protein [Anaerolineae bacterium]
MLRDVVVRRSPLPRIAALLIVLLAFVLRVIQLDAQSLWYDEGYSVQLSRTQGWTQIMLTTAQLDLNTPLHYWLLKAWMYGAGSSEFSARLLSVFGGVLGIALSWALGRMLTGHVGWVGALLLACSPAAVIAAQEARTYAWLGSAALAATATMLVAHRKPSAQRWASWAALALLTLGLHVLGAVVVGLQALLVWLGQRRARGARAAAATVMLAVLVVVLLLLPYRARYGVSFSAPADVRLVGAGTLAAQVLPRALPQPWVTPSAFVVSTLLVLTIIWGAQRHERRQIVALLGLSLVALVAFFAWSGKFSARHPLIVQPLFTALVGIMMQSALAQRRALLIVLAGTAAVFSLAGVLEVRRSPVYANEDFRGALGYLREAIRSDERLILVSGHFAPVVDYYWDRSQSRHIALPDVPLLDLGRMLTYEEVVPVLNTELRGHGGAWLLLWQDDVIDPTGLVPELLRRQAVDLGAREVITRFHGLRLVHYRFFQPYQPLPERIPQSAARVVVNRQQVGLSSVGCAAPASPRAGAPWIEVWCFWQIKPFRLLPAETQVSLRLIDVAGSVRAQQDQVIAPRGLPYLPYEKPIFAPYFFPLPADIPPGEYAFHIVPYTAEGEIAPQVWLPLRILPP